MSNAEAFYLPVLRIESIPPSIVPYTEAHKMVRGEFLHLLKNPAVVRTMLPDQTCASSLTWGTSTREAQQANKLPLS